MTPETGKKSKTLEDHVNMLNSAVTDAKQLCTLIQLQAVSVAENQLVFCVSCLSGSLSHKCIQRY